MRKVTNQDAYPLCWPEGRRRALSQSRARFKISSFAYARDTLIQEISRLGGSGVILSTDIPLRQDGLPYANYAQPKDKGVAVYFELRKRPMVFACDEWDRIEHNIWAIAKTIEALRGIERWGSGEMVERAFTGFTALPAPAQKKHWREVLGFMGGVPVRLPELLARRNELAAKHHPDVGGKTERMSEINDAFVAAKEEIGA